MNTTSWTDNKAICSFYTIYEHCKLNRQQSNMFLLHNLWTLQVEQTTKQYVPSPQSMNTTSWTDNKAICSFYTIYEPTSWTDNKAICSFYTIYEHYKSNRPKNATPPLNNELYKWTISSTPKLLPVQMTYGQHWSQFNYNLVKDPFYL